MTSPYGPPGGNDPQQQPQWGQQPYGGGPTPGTPSGGFPAQGGGYGQHSPYGQPDPQHGQHSPYGPPDPQSGPQPTQQYGQPDPQQPYGGYGQQQPYGGYPMQQGQQQPYGGYPMQGGPGGYPGPPVQQKKSGGTWIWVAVVVLVLAVAAVGVLGFVTPGFFNKKVFDESALEGDNGVKKILVENYNEADVESVDCPADQEVKKDAEFTCTVRLGGENSREATVKITVKDDDGQYEVAPPEDK